MRTFAERLRYALHKNDMKQSVLSYKTGIDKSYISKYLSGAFVPKYDRIALMAKALHVSESWLAGHSEVDNNDTSMAPKGIKIPVLGYVAAGIPIEAITEILDYEDINADMFKDGSEYFALQIKGSSMEPRIKNGDVVIVRKQSDCNSGDVAIVSVNGDDATCKRIMKHESGITLVPFNPAFETVFFPNNEIVEKPITIWGKVVELRAKNI